ncbi:MAG: dTDP-glucose 4,6-dehydratase [Betaproteobacteria bacterium TMED156]|nr:MAG: dTDP-glucose 4,6-dehydratase [Betaproteobacteria bacterium TMED156]
MILITGGAGFIGSNFVLHLLNDKVVQERIVVLDCLTYAGNMNNLASAIKNPNFIFEKCDINDKGSLKSVIKKFSPKSIIHFAAESHVDRSIIGPSKFIQTNICGTYNLLESFYEYFLALSDDVSTSNTTVNEITKKNFRFIHVSTDEVYGSLNPKDPGFTENHPFKPNSPYASSKASSDLLVRAWNKTYGLPTIITNCSNNYGPYQFPEKLIPLVISNAMDHKPIPIYGNGQQIRDWIFVEDHCEAINLVLKKGLVGETYNIGGNCECKNIDLVKMICSILDKLLPIKNSNKIKSYKDLIKFVPDRPGHDERYSVNNNKIKKNLAWKPRENLPTGLKKTIEWYIKNTDWILSVKNKSYRNSIDEQYCKNSVSKQND